MDIPVNQQVHMGNYHVTLRPDGTLQVHIWPTDSVVVSRSTYKDTCKISIKRKYPKHGASRLRQALREGLV